MESIDLPNIQPIGPIERSPEQELFSLQAQLQNLQKQLEIDRSYNNDQAVIDTSAKIAAIQKRMEEIMNTQGRTMSNQDRQMQQTVMPNMSNGDEVNVDKLPKGLKAMYKSGPKGREGVENIAAKTDKFAEGDEVNMMLMEMESADDEVMPTEASVDEGMMELEGMQPEMQMLDQYVQQVVQMIQAGASEQEVIEMLMQAGLDEEDINAIFQAVLEVLEGGMQANPIDDQLAQIS